MKFSFLEQHRIIAAFGVAFVVGGCFWFFLIRPLSGRIAEEQSGLARSRDEQERLTEDRARFERLRSGVAILTPEDVQKIDRIVPHGRDVPHLIVELEALASETGVVLKDVGVTEGRSDVTRQLPKGVKPIDLVVTVTGGDYSTLKRFLAALEKNARLLDVKNFTFAKGLQSYIINLEAYYIE